MKIRLFFRATMFFSVAGGLVGLALASGMRYAKNEAAGLPRFSYSRTFKNQKNGIVVLAYHRVLTDSAINKVSIQLTNNEELRTYNVPLSKFERQMAFLSKHHVKVISYQEMLNKLYSGDLRGRYAVLTFDDIDTTVSQNVMPIIEHYNFPMTVFVITGQTGNNLGGSQLATWQQVQRIQMYQNATIGLHTNNLHYQVGGKPVLQTDISKKRMINDYWRSQTAMTKHFGRQATLFAFPYGAYNERLTTYMSKHGIESVATLDPGVVDLGTDVYRVPRMIVTDQSWRRTAQWLINK